MEFRLRWVMNKMQTCTVQVTQESLTLVAKSTEMLQEINIKIKKRWQKKKMFTILKYLLILQWVSNFCKSVHLH